MSPTVSAPLDPVRRDAVVARVLEISSALRTPHDDWVLSQRPDNSGLRTVSLALGRSGTAVFEAWLHRSGLDDGAENRALDHLGDIVELLPSVTMDVSLLCGFPGVGWTTEHLVKVLGLELEHDVNGAIDDMIFTALDQPGFHLAYDLIDGLAGLAVYAIERQGRPTGPRLMAEVLDRLEASAVAQSTGISWPTGQVTRAAHARDVAPDERYFNLGLSHGVPGAIASLALLHRLGLERDRVTPLLEGGVDWLRTMRLPGDPGTRGMYPDYHAEGESSDPARLAWCYGDPGVAAALVAAGRTLERTELVDFGVDVAHAAANRAIEGCGVVDDGFCHGTAGLVHVFHRLYRATGDPVCRDAMLAWLDRLLARNEGEPNIAGLTTFCFERTQKGETIEDPAWLTGAAGAGLVLISLLFEPDRPMPDWDRPFLLDLGD